jgi:hypothetical protein
MPVADALSQRSRFGLKAKEPHRMTEQSIDDRERYVGYATHCLLLAKATADRASRAILKEMAAEWLKLAEAAGKSNGRA